MYFVDKLLITFSFFLSFFLSFFTLIISHQAGGTRKALEESRGNNNMYIMKIALKFLFIPLIMLFSIGTTYAKVYATIEKIYVKDNCKVIVIAWYDDNNTPNNSADDRRLATDTLIDCP
jgi:hypothetical protein